MSLINAQGSGPRGQTIQVTEWSDPSLPTLTATINTALQALLETKVLELVIRFDGTNYYAYAITGG